MPADSRAGTAADRPVVHVVAGALFDAEGRVLIAERPAGKHMAGRWEFPGGKVDPGEDEGAALRRELTEELGIEVVEARPFLTLTHDYADRRIELSMWIVARFRGEPRGLDGQRLRWIDVRQLPEADMLEADRPLVEALVSRAAAAEGSVTIGPR
ncbi:MAG: 8-oxo-dGTP diphosphatase MutT [Steroidobacteraceae bacterium]